MLNQISKLSLLVVLAIAFVFTSCEKENVEELTSNYTVDTESTTDLDLAMRGGGEKGSRGERGNNGRRGGKCLQVVYPLTYNLPDGTVIEVADRAAAKEALQAWKEANPDAEERPTIAFPYDVQLQDSSIVAVTSQEEIDALKEACQSESGDRGNRGDKGDRGNRGDRGDRGNRGGDRNGRSGRNACFSLVYPYTIDIDGTTTTIEDRAGKKTAIMAWKEANPDATEKPSVAVVFPLTVELEDDSTMEIADQAALDALKASCSEE